MPTDAYVFRFETDVNPDKVTEVLLRAVDATEALYGRSRVRMDARFFLDREKRSCVIDAGKPAGESLAQILTGGLTRELGEEAFRVERVASQQADTRNTKPTAGADDQDEKADTFK